MKGTVIYMKVVAGTARGMNLEVPQGRHTRPTTGRIKETLFNIIQLNNVQRGFAALLF